MRNLGESFASTINAVTHTFFLPCHPVNHFFVYKKWDICKKTYNKKFSNPAKNTKCILFIQNNIFFIQHREIFYINGSNIFMVIFLEKSDFIFLSTYFTIYAIKKPIYFLFMAIFTNFLWVVWLCKILSVSNNGDNLFFNVSMKCRSYSLITYLTIRKIETNFCNIFLFFFLFVLIRILISPIFSSISLKSIKQKP